MCNRQKTINDKKDMYYCTVCSKKVNTHLTENQHRKLTIGNAPIEIDTTIRRCNICNNEVNDIELEDLLVKKIQMELNVPIRVTQKEYDVMPAVLYHATLFKNLDSIASNGLGYLENDDANKSMYDEIYRGNGIFLAYEPSDALMYLSDEDADDVVLIQIPKYALDQSKLYYDTNDYTNIDHISTVYYDGIIKNPQHVCTIIDDDNKIKRRSTNESMDSTTSASI